MTEKKTLEVRGTKVYILGLVSIGEGRTGVVTTNRVMK